MRPRIGPLAYAPRMEALIRWARRRWKPVSGFAFTVAFLAAIFVWVLPRLIDYGDVWDALTGLAWPWWIALLTATIINIATFAPPMMAVLPGLRFRPALAVALASNASTYLAPGGAAIGAGFQAAMLRGWGVRGGDITLAIGLYAIWNQLVIFGSPALAFALLTYEGGRYPLLQTMALIGLFVFAGLVVFFALALRSPEDARRVGDLAARVASRLLRVVRRPPVDWSGATFVDFRADAVHLIRARWHWLTLATIMGHYTVYLVLVVAMYAVGLDGEVTLIESFAAWSLVRVLGSLPLLPGGFGLVEIGLTGALVAFGGGSADVFAAVLLYRFLTIVPPVALGALFAITWQRHHPRWREGAEEPVGARASGG